MEVSVSREWTPLYSVNVSSPTLHSVSVSREWTPLYSYDLVDGVPNAFPSAVNGRPSTAFWQARI